jgi:prepilin-type N-terminal cleavage/methylation domain-containing protein/prepilin-type processing-associated H-X9-DG protein
MFAEQPHRYARQSSRQPAFTLIEVLVSITIVLILAVLTFWGTRHLSESAKTTRCLGNLRQIGTAVLGYAGDHGGALPFLVSGDVDKPASHNSVWQQDLDSYLPYPKVNPTGGGRPLAGSPFFCPSADPNKSWLGTEPDYAAVGRYSANEGASGVFSQNAWGTFVPALKLVNIRNPERCLMVADACTRHSVLDGSWSMGLNADNLTVSAGVPASGLAPRHGHNGRDSRSGRVNMLFCDTHVEAFSFADPRLKDRAFVQSLLVPY